MMIDTHHMIRLNFSMLKSVFANGGVGNQPNSPQGNLERNRRIMELWREGHSMSEVAREVGVTKNVVSGVLSRNGGFNEPETLPQRLDRLEAHWMAVIREQREITERERIRQPEGCCEG